MNKRRILLIGLIVILSAALAGCQLALADKGENDVEDRLVGLLVTTEHLDLFDEERYLKDNIGSIMAGNTAIGGDTSAYEGRLYATMEKQTLTDEATGNTTETDRYVFEGIHGISYFCVRMPGTAERESYHSAVGDDAICDGHTSVNVGDLVNSISLEGTIFVSPRSALTTYYLNPVYQSDDGRVYVTAGNGMSFSGDNPAGAESSFSLSSSRTVTQDGKTVKDDSSVKLTMKVMYPPEKIVLLQMDGEGAAVSRQEYAPGAVPKAITPERSAEYIVVETYATDGEGKAQVSRSLYNGDAQSLDTFFCREDGVCVKKMTQLNWAK